MNLAVSFNGSSFCMTNSGLVPDNVFISGLTFLWPVSETCLSGVCVWLWDVCSDSPHLSGLLSLEWLSVNTMLWRCYLDQTDSVSLSLKDSFKINKINQIDPNTQNISQNTQLIPIYKTVYKTDPNTHNNRSQYTHQIPTDTTTSSSWCVPSWLICSLLVQIQWLNEWGYGGDDKMPWR